MIKTRLCPAVIGLFSITFVLNLVGLSTALAITESEAMQRIALIEQTVADNDKTAFEKVESLLGAYGNTDAVIIAGMKGLLELNQGESIEIIRNYVLGSSAPNVLSAGIQLFAKIQHPMFLNDIESALRLSNGNPQVMTAAIHTLAKWGKPAASVIIMDWISRYSQQDSVVIAGLQAFSILKPEKLITYLDKVISMPYTGDKPKRMAAHLIYYFDQHGESNSNLFKYGFDQGHAPADADEVTSQFLCKGLYL